MASTATCDIGSCQTDGTMAMEECRMAAIACACGTFLVVKTPG
jgi:hypothetical protein